MLNAEVQNYINAVNLLVADCSHLHHQFDRGRHMMQ